MSTADSAYKHYTAVAKAVEAVCCSAADEAEQSDVEHSWPGLFWLPPAEMSKRDMLALDDELAGLMEAAEVPADQHGAHTTQPQPASSVPGEASLAPSFICCC